LPLRQMRASRFGLARGCAHGLRQGGWGALGSVPSAEALG